MKQSKSLPESVALPTKISVRIHPERAQGPVLAYASVSLNDCFAVRGVKVMRGSKGLFVAMPRQKSGEEYRDICFPCTKEFRQKFDRMVLDAYQQEMAPQAQQQDAANSFQENTKPNMSMKI